MRTLTVAMGGCVYIQIFEMSAWSSIKVCVAGSGTCWWVAEIVVLEATAKEVTKLRVVRTCALIYVRSGIWDTN